ncbi:hypothetical protein Golax_024040 [Gossypium laxum]|uniref:Uncharacterized protein n=1 Tax=Gossypium laxum TaxID=34288 RepID=A0A7J8ZAV9_9ROSI|nr:hypothetical protein [Gossypium laxum]
MVFSLRFSSTSSRYLEEDRSICFGYFRIDRLLKGSRAH